MEFTAADIRFLATERAQAAVEEFSNAGADEWEVARALLKTPFDARERAVLAEAARLLPRLRRKLGTDAYALGDELALAQSSARDVAGYKASLLAGADGRILDLCCGLGGDTLRLDPAAEVEGVDLSEARLAMFAHNHSRMRNGAAARLADVRGVDVSGAFVLVDPDRRDPSDKSRNWNPASLSPSLEETRALAARARGALVKLPPGGAVDCFGDGVQAEFLGRRRECCELLVRAGALAERPGFVRAVHVDSGESVGAELAEARRAAGEVELGAPEGFLCEPSPALLRSGLDRWMARGLGLRMADRDVAYFFSDRPVLGPFWDCFPLVDRSPISAGKMKRMLDARGIGMPVVKKRGIRTDIDREIAKLGRRREGAPGVLLLARFGGEPVALLAGPALKPEEEGDVRNA